MAGSTLPLTGAQYDISAGEYQATVTELGAGLRQLSRRGQQVITSYGADEMPPSSSGELLAPWPNRVDGGRYSLDGSSHQLDLSEPARGNAIHGLSRWASWRVSAHETDAVELTLDLLGHAGYPFRLELRAGFRLTAEKGLQVTVAARYTGSRPAPFGTGSHPYLRAGHGTDGRARTRLTGPDADLTLWAGPGYGWLQVFTGDTLGPDTRRRAVAIEPMTCPPNAFVTGTDLLIIEPGESTAHQWGIEATVT